MDIISHYSAYTPARTSAASRTGTKVPGAGNVSGGEFLNMAKAQGRIGPGAALYNGSATRAKLSDTEIAVLANKYDPHNMDQDTYDAFLDDLQGMGAISELEKRQLGYNGWQLIAYVDKDGKTVHCGSPSGVYHLPDSTDLTMCMIAPWEADTDLHKWLGERTQKELMNVFEPSTQESAEAYENLLKGLFDIVGRMEVRRADNEEAERKAELVRQLADRNSDFYTNMRTTLKAQVDKTKEDEEEQAIIDALGAVLDALSGKKDVSGHKESVNKSAADLTKKIGEKIARLRQEDPNNPEIARLENMLKRLQEMGIYIDLSDMDGLWQDEDENFETLTQLLARRQAEEISAEHPTEKEVNEPA